MNGNDKYAFEIGHSYTRGDVFGIVGLQPHPTGGDWFTGYTAHGGAFFIFSTVGVPCPFGERAWKSQPEGVA